MRKVVQTLIATALAFCFAVISFLVATVQAENNSAQATSAKPSPSLSYISRDGWSVVSTSSQEGPFNLAAAAIDGNPATIWHTQFSGASPAHPHEIQIDLGSARTIAGFTYLGRQDGCSNGTIKDYEFHTSADGINWGAAAAAGTFGYAGLNLSCNGTGGQAPPERVITFANRGGRYVRLRALNEVNGLPYASMAEINIVDGSAGASPAVRGSWSGVIATPVNPVGAAVLPDGKVLMWSSYDRYTFGVAAGNQTLTAIFDPATGVSAERLVVETAHDMFCPGTSFLGDGRLLVTGGDTPGKTSIYNPATATWISGGNLNLARGYQGQTVLDDGNAFVMGGSWSGASLGKNGEVWSNGAWRYLPDALASVTLGPDPGGPGIADRHPWVFSIGNGKVAHVGPSVAMNIFDTSLPNGGTTPAGNRADDVFSQNGTAVMYDAGKILKAGGAPAYGDAAATANSYVIDVSNGVAATRTGSLRLARGMHNAVVLPNGEVIAVGGMPVPVGFSDTNSIFTAEIWSPASGAWRDAAPTSVPRNYHSVALLLPDGRVLSGGGGLCGQGCPANHSDVQIYTPGYLFNADGSAASRPAISQAPAVANHGGSIDVTTTGGATQFVLVRYAAVTHSVNTDQRRVPLAATPQGNGYFRLSIPNAGIAPPGNYMLFALDSKGAPSVSKTVLVQAPPRPSVAIAAPASGANFIAPASVVIHAAVADPAQNVVRVEFYNGAALLGQDTAAPYTFTWTNAPVGAYTLRATVVDATGYSASATTPIAIAASQTFTATPTIGAAQGNFAGAAFELRCQASEVLVGLTGRASAGVDQAGPSCVAVNASGEWMGSPTARGAAGGSTGTAFTVNCPANQAVSGFRGRSASGVNQLELACQALSSGGNVSGATAFLGPVGGSGGSVNGATYCPAPIPAAGIRGVAGALVGTFGLSCSVPAIVPNRPPAISLISPAANAVYTAPADIVIAASVADPDNNLARVEFFSGATKLSEKTGAPFTFNWTSVLAGSYGIRAVATDIAGLTASAAVSVTVNNPAGSPPRVLQSLRGTPVPQPAAINSFIVNRAAAIAVGKAFFWDTQVSSDGRVACASCHFQAGADVRFKHQSNPGMNRAGVSQFNFAPTKSGAAASGPNYKLKPGDFPTYVLSDPLNGNSAATFQTADVVGSQGAARRSFTAAAPGQAADTCADVADPVFGNLRQVTARNAPTVINAVFNHRNFHDGRANNVFNGVDPFGDRNAAAVIYRGASAAPTRIALENSSLASQAMSPAVSGEMACAGRTWPDVGRRLLKAKPLASQAVSATDSALASYVAAGARGLNGDYEALIRSAFAADLWNSAAQVSINGKAYTQAEANFSLFYGLAVQLYQSTLVSDDAPLDRYFGAYPGTTPVNPAALSAEQTLGLSLFLGKGNCISCHSGPQLTNAGTPALQAAQNGVLADRMFQGNASTGVYDFGFYNIGLRTTSADIGLGGADPFGNPLSFTRQAVSGARRDTFSITPCAFSAEACAPIDSGTRAVVDGAFKTPTLRNVALTGPYFHDGSRATLEDVVDFYIRGTDVRAAGAGDSTGFGANPSNLAGGLPRIELSATDRQALVSFLKVALTDDRVAFERAPFDHPELPLTDGHTGANTDVVVIPAVGQAGRSTPVAPFADLVAAGTLGYPVAPNLPPNVATPAAQSSAVNAAVSLQISASDPEGDAVTYSAAGLPTGLGINPATGLISGTASAAGSFSAAVTARDAAGNAATVNFNWSVNALPVTVSLTAPTSVTLPASITLSATAAQAGGAISRVEFYDGAALLGTAAAAPYQFIWTSAAAGAHSVTARAYGAANVTATSAAVNITVNPQAGGSCAFPSIAVTDNFNRANGALGASWAGNVSGYSINGNQAVSSGTDAFVVSPAALGVDQEAYVKFTNIAAGLSEADVILKSGASTWWEQGALIVAYLPGYRVIQVWTYDNSAFWVMRTEINATLANGDVFGARVRGATGAVEVYRNGAVIGNASVAGWSRQNATGMAGVWMVGGAGSSFDDFGAGTLTCAAGGGGNQAPTVSVTATAVSNTVTINATAADADGSIAKVEFFNGAAKLGEDLTAPYSFAWTSVAAGTYAITAKATDNAGAATTSAVASVTVSAPGNQAPTVSVTATAASNTVTINATAADADGSIAKVEFFNGAAKLGEDLTAPYSFTWTSVAAGTYAITAKATDNAGAATTSAVASVTVSAPGNQAPTVSVTATAASNTVTINATAADADGSIAKVEFFNGAAKLGEDLTAPYSFAWTSVAAGTYAITAKATNNAGAATTSAVASVTVSAPGNQAPTVSVTATAASNTVTINATAADADGSIAKVEFFNGAAKLGEDLTAPYSFAWTSVAAGTYAITAKATNNAGAATTSAVASVTVSAPGNQAPTVSVTATAASNTVTINATAADADGSIAKVEFFNGAAKLGEDLTAPYSFTWTSVAAGTYAITAKATDNAGAATTSAVASVTVSAPGSCAFPSIPAATDSFNRANSSSIGGSWAGSTGGYAISNNQLTVGAGDQYIVWNQVAGPAIEASVKITGINAAAQEIDLVLKSVTSIWYNGSLIVAYTGGRLQVWSAVNGNWTQHSNLNVQLAAGDVLGGRARPNGTVEVYKNGALIGSATATGWPYLTATGFSGLWVVGGAGTSFDDFRTGTLTCQ